MAGVRKVSSLAKSRYSSSRPRARPFERAPICATPLRYLDLSALHLIQLVVYTADCISRGRIMNYAGIFASISVGLSVCFLIPDIFLARATFFENRSRAARYFLSSMVVAIPICLSGVNFLSVSLLSFIFILIAAWYVNYQYFGEVLTPDSLALLIKPDHFRDVVSVEFDDIWTFVPTLSLVALCLGGSLYLASLSPSHDFQWWFSALAWLVLISTGVRIALRRRSRHDYPRAHMTGLFGGLHALAMAIKWGFTLAKTLPGTVKYSVQPAQDALIVVLMGESINPARMGLFSGLNTTPKIDAVMAGTRQNSRICKDRIFCRSGIQLQRGRLLIRQSVSLAH